ncbi:hypothetical protein [Janthinobacterium sp. 78]|uniref:hypothetical protein n=1 Tax=Janthinobacterium sp. 78 TaxID=2135631 RepID=UPI000D5D68B9|nr:hypothetical protein [Janthinobacterium sp. 78]PVX38175.1 hypothetical protein C8C92_4843 [Janthinobacterium sp. 78]
MTKDGLAPPLGVFIERNNWDERVLLPTGKNASPFLELLLKEKPLVGLIDMSSSQFARAKADDPNAVK